MENRTFIKPAIPIENLIEGEYYHCQTENYYAGIGSYLGVFGLSIKFKMLHMKTPQLLGLHWAFIPATKEEVEQSKIENL